MVAVKNGSILSIQATSTVASTIRFTVTTMLPDGNMNIMQDVFTSATDGAAVSKEITLPECTLLSVVVGPGGVPMVQGQCFVVGILYHSTVSPQLIQHVLFSQYLIANGTVSYPGSPTINPTQTGGRMRLYSIANPAAGANVVGTVPSGFAWRPVGFKYTLTASAGVATRAVQMAMSDGTTIFYQSSNNATSVASEVKTISFAKDASLGILTILGFSMPTPVLQEGFKIQSLVTNIQAGDQISDTQLLVEEWALA